VSAYRCIGADSEPIQRVFQTYTGRRWKAWEYRRWVEEALIGEIKDPFEAVKWQHVLGREGFLRKLKDQSLSKSLIFSSACGKFFVSGELSINLDLVEIASPNGLHVVEHPSGHRLVGIEFPFAPVLLMNGLHIRGNHVIVKNKADKVLDEAAHEGYFLQHLSGGLGG
jgi:hypothetical protein